VLSSSQTVKPPEVKNIKCDQSAFIKNSQVKNSQFYSHYEKGILYQAKDLFICG